MRSLPFAVTDLPESLRSVVQTALDREDPAEARQRLDDWLASGELRTAPVLIALAYLEMEYALAIMVDQGLKRSTRALALLEEAIALGADKRRLRDFRHRCQAVREGELEEAAKSKRLRDVDLSCLKPNEIVSVAHDLLEEGGPENITRAAELWLHVAALEEDEGMRYDHTAMAGHAYAKGEMWDKALPILERTVRLPVFEPDYRWWDMIESAYSDLLRHSIHQIDGAQFRRLWLAAVDVGQRCEDPNTFYPSPDPFLAAAFEFKHKDLCQRMLTCIDNHTKGLGRLPPAIAEHAEMRKLVETVRAYVNQQ